MTNTAADARKSRFQAPGDQLPSTSGIVLHSPVLYDITVWLAFLGKEHLFREKALNLARIVSGESVLDVGCGTGTLAIAAKKRVGGEGTVHGLDASTEMLASAEKKARKAGVEVFFKSGVAEALPFPGAQFNVVLSTVMLHHLPKKARLQCVTEIRRVLKPDGRVLVIDFEGCLLADAGLKTIESGPVGIRDLQFVLATASCCS